jgi:hypothetical protein
MSPRASVGGDQKQPRIKARPLAWRSAHWSAVCAACCARSRANGFYGCWASHSARFCRPMGRGSVRPGSNPFVRRFVAHPVEIVKRILVRRSWPGTPRSVPAAPRRVDSRPSKPRPASARIDGSGTPGGGIGSILAEALTRVGFSDTGLNLHAPGLQGAISTEYPAIPFDVIVKSVNPSASPVKANATVKSTLGPSKQVRPLR